MSDDEFAPFEIDWDFPGVDDEMVTPEPHSFDEDTVMPVFLKK